MKNTAVKTDKYYIIDDSWAEAREAFVSHNCGDYNTSYEGYFGLDVEFDTAKEAQDFCDKYNAYDGVEGRELNCCSDGCYMTAFDYGHWNGKCAFTGNFEEEEKEEYTEREPRIKRKKYLHEKKRLKRLMKSSEILKENKAYKKAWLNKHKTAIYSHGFHPAWGEPVEIGDREVVPMFLETTDGTRTLPYKEAKILKILIPLKVSQTWFYVSNVPLED